MHAAFAKSQQEVLHRAKQAEENDPLPDVPMALLSAADIESYVRETAMLHPFYSQGLKSASYEIHAGGLFVYWQRDGNHTGKFEKHVDRHSDDKKIILPANSISYIQTEAEFRLPPYIAIRFNLRITHVHRGLLLGTGPLVDPGFAGKLLIPLHNLTSEDYEISLDDALIWVEFTKTSFIKDRAGEKPFPPEKKYLQPHDYFEKANRNEPILSSIPDALDATRVLAQTAESKASSAERSAKRASTTLTRIGSIGVVATLLALGGLIYAGFEVVEGALSVSTGVKNDLSSLVYQSHKDQQLIGELRQSFSDQVQQVSKLQRRNAELELELTQVKSQVDQLAHPSAKPR